MHINERQGCQEHSEVEQREKGSEGIKDERRDWHIRPEIEEGRKERVERKQCQKIRLVIKKHRFDQ